jgi:hypothetical protein
MKYMQRLMEIWSKETQVNHVKLTDVLRKMCHAILERTVLLRHCMTYSWWNAVGHEVRFVTCILAASCCVNRTICMPQTTVLTGSWPSSHSPPTACAGDGPSDACKDRQIRGFHVAVDTVFWDVNAVRRSVLSSSSRSISPVFINSTLNLHSTFCNDSQHSHSIRCRSKFILGAKATILMWNVSEITAHLGCEPSSFRMLDISSSLVW